MPGKHSSIFDRRRFDEHEEGAPPPLSTAVEEHPFVPFATEVEIDPSKRRDPTFRPLYVAGAPVQPAESADEEPDAQAEPEGVQQEQAEEPQEHTEAAETEAEPEPQPGFTEADIEAARQAGHAEGLEAGRAAAQEESAARTGDALEKIADGLAGLDVDRSEEIAEAAAEAVRIGVAVVNQLFPTIRAKAADREVKAFVTRHLGDAADARALSVQVHEDLVETVTGQMQQLAERSGFSGTVSVQAGDGMEPGDARLDWREGGVERLYETLWTGIRAALVRSIGPLEPSEKAMAAKAANPPKPGAKSPAGKAAAAPAAAKPQASPQPAARTA